VTASSRSPSSISPGQARAFAFEQSGFDEIEGQAGHESGASCGDFDDTVLVSEFLHRPLRLDGTWIFGSTESFLIEAVALKRLALEVSALPNCARSSTYVSKPFVGNMIDIGRQNSLGPHAAGWEDCEGSHGWTRGNEIATFPLPDQTRTVHHL
jgi:hypothetical protein